MRTGLLTDKTLFCLYGLCQFWSLYNWLFSKIHTVANINRQFDKSSTELSTIHIGIRIDDF